MRSWLMAFVLFLSYSLCGCEDKTTEISESIEGDAGLDILERGDTLPAKDLIFSESSEEDGRAEVLDCFLTGQDRKTFQDGLQDLIAGDRLASSPDQAVSVDLSSDLLVSDHPVLFLDRLSSPELSMDLNGRHDTAQPDRMADRLEPPTDRAGQDLPGLDQGEREIILFSDLRLDSQVDVSADLSPMDLSEDLGAGSTPDAPLPDLAVDQGMDIIVDAMPDSVMDFPPDAEALPDLPPCTPGASWCAGEGAVVTCQEDGAAIEQKCYWGKLCEGGECVGELVADCDTIVPGYCRIPAGTFLMGSPEDELGRDEFPVDHEIQHEVTITYDFLIRRYEVTSREYEEMTGARVTYPTFGSGLDCNCPDGSVHQLRASQSMDYCNALSEREGLEPCYREVEGSFPEEFELISIACEGYRLPTEAEWEYAARVGTLMAFYTGDITVLDSELDPALDRAGWYVANRQSNTCHEPGLKEPNQWGLFDMLGNASELVGDAPTLFTEEPQIDPFTPFPGRPNYIYRGGSSGSTVQVCRAASRPSMGSSGIGARPVRHVPASYCGDGWIGVEEECDGEDLGEASCQSLGLGPGVLGCMDCRLDTAECERGGCEPGSVSCVDGTKRRVCQEDRREVEEPCPMGSLCMEGVCVPQGECGKIRDGYCLIPGGTFLMGTPEAEPGHGDDEGPQHWVTITRDFLLKQTEVTLREWGIINPSHIEIQNYHCTCGPDCPVGRVNWFNAVYYLTDLSREEGLEECYVLEGCGPSDCDRVTFVGLDCQGYRLPTEAEWEYAARAGTTTALYTGEVTSVDEEAPDGNIVRAGWCGWNEDNLHPVGQKEVNPWGLHDMIGNLPEWVWDAYELYPTEPVMDPVGDPVVEYASIERVSRGGSIDSPGMAFSLSDCRAGSRHHYYPDWPDDLYVGWYDNSDYYTFRPAITVLPGRRDD